MVVLLRWEEQWHPVQRQEDNGRYLEDDVFFFGSPEGKEN